MRWGWRFLVVSVLAVAPAGCGDFENSNRASTWVSAQVVRPVAIAPDTASRGERVRRQRDSAAARARRRPGAAAARRARLTGPINTKFQGLTTFRGNASRDY